MQRVSRACLRTFKINLNSLHPTVNQCCKHKPPVECARSHFNSSPVVNVKINFNRAPRKFSKIPARIFFAFNVVSLMQFLGLMDENEDSELIQIIKKAEIAMIKKEYNKSEQLFHVALKIAQELQNENGVTFIFDRLANLAFDTGKNEKARKLFVDVMQRLLEMGMDKNDLVMVHISFKLAKIFENVRDFETADIGYQYCVDVMKPKLTKENLEYDDAMALWIMILNGYAYFMYNVGRIDDAYQLFSQAYDACTEIGAENDEQIVLLLNNLGTVSKLKGDNEGAFNFFHKAEMLGKNFPDIDNFSYVYLNLGYLYMESKLLTEADEYCNRALNNATRHQYEEGKIEAEECLTRVKEMLQE